MIKSNKTNKIALLLNTVHGGGAERVMLSLADSWAEKGIHVDLILGKLEGHYQHLLTDKYNTIVLDKRLRGLLPALIKYLNNNEPDILLSTLYPVNNIAVLAGKLSRAKTKIILREANSPVAKLKYSGSWVFQVLIGVVSRLNYPLADGFISVSKGLRKEMIQFYNIRPEKIAVIYNPVAHPSLDQQAQATVSHPMITDNAPLILGMGRVVPQKDFVTLIRAFSIVQKTLPCKLIIVGDTEADQVYYQSLLTLIQSLNLEHDIDFIGFQKNPFTFLAQSKVFVLSSIYEGLPGVLIQAMALGCQLVSTDCPYGPREILAAGKYGKLVPVGDHKAMAKAIIESIRAPSDSLDNKEWSQQFGVQQADEYLKFLNFVLSN